MGHGQANRQTGLPQPSDGCPRARLPRSSTIIEIDRLGKKVIESVQTIRPEPLTLRRDVTVPRSLLSLPGILGRRGRGVRRLRRVRMPGSAKDHIRDPVAYDRTRNGTAHSRRGLGEQTGLAPLRLSGVLGCSRVGSLLVRLLVRVRSGGRLTGLAGGTGRRRGPSGGSGRRAGLREEVCVRVKRRRCARGREDVK